MDTCTHDVCAQGEALVPGCNACVDTVCAADDFCCDALDGGWDSACVGEAVMLCQAMCPGGDVMLGDLVITEIAARRARRTTPAPDEVSGCRARPRADSMAGRG